MATVLTLTSVQNSKAKCDFVVIGITDTKLYSFTDKDDFHNHINTVLKRDYAKEYDSFGIIYQGNLTKFNGYNSIVGKLPKRGLGGSVQYRDYTKTEEQQLNSKSNINVAEDANTSWNTVRTALGARNTKHDCFGIVLEVIKNK